MAVAKRIRRRLNMWLLFVPAFALVIVAVLRARAGHGVVFLTVPAVLLVVAGLVGVTMAHGKPGAIPGRHVAEVTGLPLPADYRLIPVLTPTGQEMYLNAAMYPLLFFSGRDSGEVRHIVNAYDRLKGVKRPLLLVGTRYRTDIPKRALAHTHRALDRAGVNTAWFAQLGSADAYVRSTPALVYYHDSRLRIATGVARITSQLKTASAFPPAPSAGPVSRRTTKQSTSAAGKRGAKP